jgi:hypothetical protein
LSQNYHTNYLVRIEVHGKGDRTAVGAFAALITGICLKWPGRFYLFKKMIIWL